MFFLWLLVPFQFRWRVARVPVSCRDDGALMVRCYVGAVVCCSVCVLYACHITAPVDKVQFIMMSWLYSVHMRRPTNPLVFVPSSRVSRILIGSRRVWIMEYAMRTHMRIILVWLILEKGDIDFNLEIRGSSLFLFVYATRIRTCFVCVCVYVQ